MNIEELKYANNRLHNLISHALECYYDEIGLTPDVYIDWIDVSTHVGTHSIPRIEIETKIK